MLEKPELNHGGKNPRHDGPSRQAIMRGIALFLDGMSRGLIFPFGPSLVYRLLHGGTLKLGMDCAKVAVPLAVVASAYVLGRGTGSTLSSRIHISDEAQPKTVARLSGAVVSLLVFTFGAGLKSVWWLFLIRFLSGIIVGLLCKITRKTAAENSSGIQQARDSSDEDLEAGMGSRPREEAALQRKDVTELTPGTAKIYMTAFAFSILTGGLLYRHATGDATFRALTGSRQFTLSPLFLIAVSVTAESVLRCFFSFFEDTQNAANEQHTCTTEDNFKPVDLLKTPTKFHEANEEAPLTISRTRTHSFGSSSFQATTRGRFDTSDSEFFDCNSVLSGMEDLDSFDDPISTVEEGADKCRYVDRKCVDAAGAPSYVPNGDSPRIIPENYLKLSDGNERKARAMWEETQRWRRQNHVWRIHTVPQKWFYKIKQAYPHFVHGVSKSGFPIVYEQPGRMALKQLFREGCRVEDMLQHYMFFLEFLSNHICTREEVRNRLGYPIPPHSSSTWGILVVMDVGGTGLSHLSGDVLTYLKGAGEINNSHYPLSLKRAFLVNSPFWLAGTWRSVKGLLPESVHVDILSSHQYLSTLREFIDDDQIPPEYGGSSPFKLGEHPFECLLKDMVEEASTGDAPVFDIEEPPSNSMLQKPHSGLTVDTGALEDTMPSIKEPHSSSGLATRRRRHDPHGMSTSTPEDKGNDVCIDEKKDRYEKAAPGIQEVGLIVSTIFILWNTVQGIIEVAIPLWILTPTELGGLGYAPSRSGVAMFSSAVVLLWVFRTKLSKTLSEIPSRAPMRSFRIGAGAQSVLLAMLAIIPRAVKPSERSDAILVMALTIIAMSGIVLSSIFGRTSSMVLHKTVSSANECISMESCGSRTAGACVTGQITNNLKFAAEFCGVISVAPFACWSLRQGRIAPFDGTCCLLLASLLAFGLYVGSFSLNQNFDGEYPQQHVEGRAEAQRPWRSFLCEVITVSGNDVASLFDGTNSSLNPFLSPRQTPWANYK